MKGSSACCPYLRLIKLSNECICLTQRRVSRIITACRTYASPSVSVVSQWLGCPTVCAYMTIGKAHCMPILIHHWMAQHSRRKLVLLRIGEPWPNERQAAKHLRE